MKLCSSSTRTVATYERFLQTVRRVVCGVFGIKAQYDIQSTMSTYHLYLFYDTVDCRLYSCLLQGACCLFACYLCYSIQSTVTLTLYFYDSYFNFDAVQIDR